MRTTPLYLLIYTVCTATTYAEEFSVDDRPALPFRSAVTFHTQCGEIDDLQDVESYDGSLGVSKDYVKKHEPSTVQFQWLSESEISSKLPDYSPGNVGSIRWCTGTLISKRHVLTAGHCFDLQREQWGWLSPWKRGVDGTEQYAKPDVLATLQQVHFGYQIDPATSDERIPDTYKIKRLLEYRLGGLDYAIVELAPKNGMYPSVMLANPLTRAPEKQEKIAIIQHPQGKPKKIEAGSVKKVSATWVFYGNIDTHSGSSGSGVRDKTGNLIGVHTNGGCTKRDGGANRGVPTKAISVVSSYF